MDANKAIDIFRYILSTVITFGAIGLIAYGISHGYAALPGHPAGLFSILIFVIILLGYLEGLQVRNLVSWSQWKTVNLPV